MTQWSFCFYYWKQPLLLETAIKSSIGSESGYQQKKKNGEYKMYSYTCEIYVMYIIFRLIALRDMGSGFSKTNNESWQ